MELLPILSGDFARWLSVSHASDKLLHIGDSIVRTAEEFADRGRLEQSRVCHARDPENDDGGL